VPAATLVRVTLVPLERVIAALSAHSAVSVSELVLVVVPDETSVLAVMFLVQGLPKPQVPPLFIATARFSAVSSALVPLQGAPGTRT